MLPSPSVSPLFFCQNEVNAASRKNKLSPSFLYIFLSQRKSRSALVYFFYCPSVKALKQRNSVYLSHYRWKCASVDGLQAVYISCLSSLSYLSYLLFFPHWTPLSFLVLPTVCVSKNRLCTRFGYFTSVCRHQSQLIICWRILSLRALRDLMLM